MRTSFLSRVFNQSPIFERNLHISRICPGEGLTLNALHTFLGGFLCCHHTTNVVKVDRNAMRTSFHQQLYGDFINSYIVIVTTCSICHM